ncbi:hypothetical protein GGQ60_000990 [Pedobacter zeae]|uniref:Uncharacterized protein n=1 Tax=Pedobacter zeae TaxID=1737356 RepID=A0A7W6KAA4_9SPHI|nr:hypothetical protein [Pedobacter zeae]
MILLDRKAGGRNLKIQISPFRCASVEMTKCIKKLECCQENLQTFQYDNFATFVGAIPLSLSQIFQCYKVQCISRYELFRYRLFPSTFKFQMILLDRKAGGRNLKIQISPFCCTSVEMTKCIKNWNVVRRTFKHSNMITFQLL